MKASTAVLAPGGPLAAGGPPAAAPDDPISGAPAKRLSPSASILRGAVALLSTQPVTWAAAVLTTIFVPRYLGDQGLGQYSLAQAAANLAGIFAALGIPVYLRRQAAARPDRAEIDAAGALVLLTAVGIATAVVLSLALPALGFMASEPLVLQLALAIMVIAGTREVLISLLVGGEHHGRFAWLNATTVVAGAVAGVGTLAAGGGVMAYVASQVAVYIVMMVPTWYFARARLPRAAFDPRLWWQLTRDGLAFFGWQVALAIRGQTGVLLLGVMVSEQVAGWYFAAQRIAAIPTFIPVMVATPLFPALSRIADDRPAFGQTMRRAILAALLLTVLPSAMVIGLAPAVPDLLGWQSSFAQSIPVMMILAVFLPIVAFNMVVGTSLMALNYERQWLLVGAAAAALNPVLNLLLITVFQGWLSNGAVGIAIAEVVTEAVMVVGALLVMPRGMLDRRVAWLSARIVLAGVCVVVATTLLRPIALPLAVATGGLAYLAAVLALRVVRPSDLQLMRQVALQALWRRRAAQHA